MKNLYAIILILIVFGCSLEKEIVDANTTPILSEYETISIGNQEWMTHNLDVTVFQNGDTILHASTNEVWESASNSKTPAWCYYEDSTSSNAYMGKLYNWYAVNDERMLAPVGFKVPEIDDWMELIDTLGGSKSAGVDLMDSINWIDGTGLSGLNLYPGGGRGEGGTFGGKGGYGFWWTSTDFYESGAFVIYIYNDRFYGKNGANKDGNKKGMGFTVRCLRKE